MDGGVKFIFKTLIRVPCLIVAAYMIFNLFCFTLTYFKMMGASYAIMQVAMENNYIPEQELKSLNSYVQQFNSEVSNNNVAEANGTGMISDISITKSTNTVIAGRDESGNHFERVEVGDRKQYGEIITYGLSYRYNWIWPLRSDQLFKTTGETDNTDGSSRGVAGLSNGSTSMRSRAQYIQENGTVDSAGTISFNHSVPGLQYYSDLD